MEFTSTVRAAFEASHELEDEPCDSLHGHTWRVTVSLMQLSLSRSGQVPGRTTLLEALRTAVRVYDQRHLNDKFVGGPPTPGNIAVNLMEQLSLRFPRISSVTVQMGEVEEVTVWRELRA